MRLENGDSDLFATKLRFYLKFSIILTIQRFTAVAEENMRNFLLMTNMMFALIAMRSYQSFRDPRNQSNHFYTSIKHKLYAQ